MDEIIFVVTEDPEGGFAARALGEAIFTEADDLPGLREHVRDAVRCHFEDGSAPRVLVSVAGRLGTSREALAERLFG